MRESLARSDFDKEFARARKEKRAPMISGHAVGIDLSGFDFTSDYSSPFGPHSGVFGGMDFRHANLRGCKMVASDFFSANFRGADLTGADLRDANLYTALFEGANLSDANLAGANLTSAELTELKADNIELTGSSFGHCKIIDVDLSSASGLADIGHHAPSAISSTTIRLTAAGLGTAPEYRRHDFLTFLNRAGLDEDLLPVVNSWIGKPVEFYSVFLSHSSKDKAFTRLLYDDLRRLGVNCWLDEKQILPGDSIMSEVDRGIRLWDRLILICSRNSLSPNSGWWVEQELERALAKERELRRTGIEARMIIPVTIDDYVFSEWSGRYRATVLERHVADFQDTSTEHYSESLASLVAALNASR